MNRLAPLLATLCFMQTAHAQTITSAVPGYISYQGRALNSAGTVMGSGTPVNRTVTFRIWDHASNSLLANLVYSETQVVTIAEGEFSVLVGAGSATAGTPLGYSETDKGTPKVKINDLSVFAGDRFLGVTIDDGTAAVDNEVSPRQQIVSSAYALRSKYAEQLGSNGGTALTALDSGNVGIGNTSPPSRFTVTAAAIGTSTPQMIITADDVTERLRLGVDSTGTGTGFIQSFKEGIGGGAQNLLLNPNGGNVGIGTTTPNFPLSMSNTLGDKIALYGTSGAHFGFGIQNNQFQMHTDTSAADVVFGYGTSAAMTETMRIKGNGKVGIGKSAPESNLDVQGFTSYRGNPYTIASFAANATLAPLNITQGNSGLNPAISAGKNSAGDFDSLSFMTKDIERIKISAEGMVGIGTATPGFPLNMSNAMGDKIALWGNSGNSSGFGIQSNLLQIHTDTSAGDVAFGYGSSAAMTETMRIKGNGNVGIGTASPTYKLDVAGNARVTGQIHADSNFIMGKNAVLYGYNSDSRDKPVFWPRAADNGTYLNIGTGGLFIRDEDNNVKMRMYAASGAVLFGTTSTTEGQLNVGTKLANYRRIGGVSTDGGSSTDSDRVNMPVSIWADGTIVTSLLDIHSDARIKNILHPTDSIKDLQTLMAIQITDYRLKDIVANSKAPQKKVIAQQVEQVFPQAVSVRKGIVPDIYKNAQVKDHWVMLATNLKVGERVRLISASGESVEEVLEVRGDAFRSSLKSAVESIFVYGREVSDFRTVDYDALAMLNVSATQELARQLETVQDENAALRRELAAKDKSMEARLIALERRMSGESAARTVSLKTASVTK